MDNLLPDDFESIADVGEPLQAFAPHADYSRIRRRRMLVMPSVGEYSNRPATLSAILVVRWLTVVEKCPLLDGGRHWRDPDYRPLREKHRTSTVLHLRDLDQAVGTAVGHLLGSTAASRETIAPYRWSAWPATPSCLSLPLRSYPEDLEKF